MINIPLQYVSLVIINQNWFEKSVFTHIIILSMI